MYAYTKVIKKYKGNYFNRIGPQPLLIIIRVSICLVDKDVCASFDEIPSMNLQDFKETVYAYIYKSHSELQREITHRIGS